MMELPDGEKSLMIYSAIWQHSWMWRTDGQTEMPYCIHVLCLTTTETVLICNTGQHTTWHLSYPCCGPPSRVTPSFFNCCCNICLKLECRHWNNSWAHRCMTTLFITNFTFYISFVLFGISRADNLILPFLLFYFTTYVVFFCSKLIQTHRLYFLPFPCASTHSTQLTYLLITYYLFFFCTVRHDVFAACVFVTVTCPCSSTTKCHVNLFVYNNNNNNNTILLQNFSTSSNKTQPLQSDFSMLCVDFQVQQFHSLQVMMISSSK